MFYHSGISVVGTRFCASGGHPEGCPYSMITFGGNYSALTPNPSPERAFGTGRGASSSLLPPLLAA